MNERGEGGRKFLSARVRQPSSPKPQAPGPRRPASRAPLPYGPHLSVLPWHLPVGGPCLAEVRLATRPKHASIVARFVHRQLTNSMYKV